MIIMGIFGGLASQMNQYAMLTELRRRFPDECYKIAIADSWLDVGQHNGYELERVFGIREEHATKKEILRLSNFYPGKGLKSRVCNRLIYMRNQMFGCNDAQITPVDPTIFNEEHFNLQDGKDYFFWGNWIAEEYFMESEQELRNIFIFDNLLNGRNASVADQIRECCSTSIHVRRGDYIDAGFSVLPMDYYKKACELILEKESDSHFFIFSDDAEYVSDSFSFLENKTIVTNNSGKDNYIDMQLMSMCKHNIIANSGFSFWGAWLNSNPDKIVIAPSKHVSWCKNPIALNEWIKIDI